MIDSDTGAWCRSALLVVVWLLAGVAGAQPAAAHEGNPEPYVYEQATINPALSPLGSAVTRSTPRAALDFFFTAIDSNDPRAAAHLLNLSALS